MLLTKIAHIDNLIAMEVDDSGLSLEFFCEQLHERINKGDTGASLFSGILQELAQLEEKYGKLSIENIRHFEEAYGLIFGMMNNLTKSEDIAWALGTPIPSTIIAGTGTMYALIGQELKPVQDKEFSKFHNRLSWPNELLYGLVLERLYSIKPKTQSLIYEFVNTTGTSTFVNLQVDFSLVKVVAKNVLPDIDFSCVRDRDMMSPEDIQPLLESVHLDNFIFEGVSILRFQNCTDQYVRKEFQHMIGNLSKYNRTDLSEEIASRIRSVVGRSTIYSSLYPVLYLNGIPILKEEVAVNSVLFSKDSIHSSIDFQRNMLAYLDSPFILSYGVHPDLDTTIPYFLKLIKKAKVKSYVCCPLKYQDELVGFIELYTRGEELLLPTELSHLSSFFPLLTQLAFDLRLEFKSRLDDVILQHYTSLQPAVQWRFNIAAATYLKNIEKQQSSARLEEVSFKEVYPLYGVIDVKDSTALRNLAFRKDNRQRLKSIRELVTHIPIDKYPDKPALHSFQQQLDHIATWLATDRMNQYMQEIIAFFEEDVPTFILTLSWLDPLLDKEISLYSKSIGANTYQAAFEESLQKVNAVIDAEIVKLDAYVQTVFPSYFEKFRSDGLEYDFYVGQSISPNTTFDVGMLRDLRRQQMISMVHICKSVEDIVNSLPIALKTTQLIFVHPSTIDISFRSDERRFDVEGGYNIRYQMIKKRIDKVLIRGSKERLVQPGMVAVVMQGQGEFSSLKEEMLLLSEQGFFKQGIEELDLEELQGVSGLKALRAGICSGAI